MMRHSVLATFLMIMLGGCTAAASAPTPTNAPLPSVGPLPTAPPTEVPPTITLESIAANAPPPPPPTITLEPIAANTGTQPPPTDAPTDVPPTDVPPTITLEPIAPNLPATPTITLEPFIANTFPQSSEFNDSDNPLAFQTTFPDNTSIESVTLEIYEGDKQVHQQVEQNAPYCAFGDQNDNCNVWRFADHNNQWPSGEQAQDGATYRLVATSRTKDGRTQVDTLTFVLHLSP
jgi:hypothetical protein